jgi:hypothetical protein
MHIELTNEERNILVKLLMREISEIGPEIRRTQTSSYRDGLKEDKRALRELLERLSVKEPV